MRDGAALVPLRATSHTPVPDWLMGMGSEGQEVEYTPSERARARTHPYGGSLGSPKSTGGEQCEPRTLFGVQGEGRDGKVKKGLTLVGY